MQNDHDTNEEESKKWKWQNRVECSEVHRSKVSFPLSNKSKGRNGNIEKEKESGKGRWFLLGLTVSQKINR